ESFLQAYKRLQYMKQYENYRKEQGEKIKEETQKLQQLNVTLTEQRAEKRKILAENRATQKKLEKDKKEQQELIAQLKKKGSNYKKKIKEKQREIARIDAQIKKLVREAIAAENKKAGSSSKSAFKLTPEAKA